MRAWVVYVVLLLAAAAPLVRAQMSAADGSTQQITGFRVPSYDAENNLTSQLFGDSARILPDGRVDITGLRLEFYSSGETGRVTEMKVTSPRCLYERSSNSATSAAPVRLARDNMVVTGTGFAWMNKEQRMEIYSDAKVVIRDAQRSMKGIVKP